MEYGKDTYMIWICQLGKQNVYDTRISPENHHCRVHYSAISIQIFEAEKPHYLL